MQQASHNPFGVTAPTRSPLGSLLLSGGNLNTTSSGLSAGLLSQLDNLGGPVPATSSDSVEGLSTLPSSQGLLGFGGSNQLGAGSNIPSGGGLVGNSLYHPSTGTGTTNIESAGVSDALSLLARAIPRSDGNTNNSGHGFGGVHERQDERYG